MTGPASAADAPEIRASGVLRVLVSADEAPEAFSTRPAGPPGFDRELLEGLRAALDEYIGNVRRSGSWKRLVVKYYGQSALDIIGHSTP